MRITGFVTELNSNEIFVFGSNTIGKHGKGAAQQALRWGAKWGVGNGLSGKTYGIPTKDHKMKTLHTRHIRKYVDEFIEFAAEKQDLKFLVTEIGCGLAGYKPEQIAPMFIKALELSNVYLPNSFYKTLSKTTHYIE